MSAISADLVESSKTEGVGTAGSCISDFEEGSSGPLPEQELATDPLWKWI